MNSSIKTVSWFNVRLSSAFCQVFPSGVTQFTWNYLVSINVSWKITKSQLVMHGITVQNIITHHASSFSKNNHAQTSNHAESCQKISQITAEKNPITPSRKQNRWVASSVSCASLILALSQATTFRYFYSLWKRLKQHKTLLTEMTKPHSCAK